MHGNVWELCLDWAGSVSRPMMDPKGMAWGYSRILRGGGWGDKAMECRAFRRLWLKPNRHTKGFGFRVALTMRDR
ncbi:MAG: SUMF1/EgtB/PvdO family nonheme iron enzyme [Kiritimatiellae bacterium]|nr:SUMF1/EgtB/PvdO family nonheme iron enzyme [Kiritimatiellia bacterium]